MAIEAMRRQRPDVAFEVVHLSTEGDERRDVSLKELGGTGVFVKRIERALLAGEIDLAVHSLKDVPTQIEPGLRLVAIPARADPRDALVVAAPDRPGYASPVWSIEELARERLPELVYGARVGTSSQRRAAQLLALRDDLVLGDVRGNVDTRLRKLDAGDYDALVLAAAGLDRLGRADRITRRLDPDELLPMIGQGALAIEARADDTLAIDVAGAIDDAATRACVETERAFLAALGGGCTLPVGALAVLASGELWLRVAVAEDGRIERRERRGPVAQGMRMAADLARGFGMSTPAWVPLCQGEEAGRQLTGGARTLAGRRVLVTRGSDQAGELLDLLRRVGADVVELPSIEVLPVVDPAALDDAFARLGRYAWVVFTSANGVRHTFARATAGSAHWPRIAAVGAATRAALNVIGLPIAFEPSESRGDMLARELPVAPGQRVLLLRSDLADARLPAALRARGALVDDVVAYRTTPRTRPAPKVVAQIAAGQIDAVLLASPSSARGLVAACGAEAVCATLPAIAIGPTTAAAARELGLTVAGQAVEPSARGLVAALIQAMEERHGARDRA